MFPFWVKKTSVILSRRLPWKRLGKRDGRFLFFNAAPHSRHFLFQKTAMSCLAGGFLFSTLAGCQIFRSNTLSAPPDCIKEMVRKLEGLPEKLTLTTLDGQQVELQEFFETCSQNWPRCALYPKFYYWNSEIRYIESKSETGIVKHKVRLYYNIVSTCQPEKVNPGRTHGDVAEFYDENGVFMGLAVYMGNGMYCPLPHSKYKAKRSLYF